MAKVASKVLAFKVRDLAEVDAKRLAGIKWPAGVNTLSFRPRRAVEGVYALLMKNIPARYKVRLVYHALLKDIRVPAATGDRGIASKPLRSGAEVVREFKSTFMRDFVRRFYPARAWRGELAVSLPYFKDIKPAQAFRAVNNGSSAGLMVLLDYKLDERPVTLVAWVWIRRTLTIAERRQVQHLMLAWLKSNARGKIVAGVDGFNPGSQGFFRKSGFDLIRLNISKDRASLAEPVGIMPYMDWLGTYKKAWGAVEAADYAKAIGALRPAFRKYPGDFKVVKTYAMVLGDYADGLAGARKAALKARACSMLAGLVKKLWPVRWEWNIATRNEYYYHSGQFRKQYWLGVESAAGGHKWGNYGQGVGAANCAYEHAAAGRSGLARYWARRAVNSWEGFFKFKADYYNAYVHYALALGVLGRYADMDCALARSAKLSGKPASYREFAEVRQKISILLSN